MRKNMLVKKIRVTYLPVLLRFMFLFIEGLTLKSFKSKLCPDKEFFLEFRIRGNLKFLPG
jgi:hypothetical protein